jgi:hypothetical protein
MFVCLFVDVVRNSLLLTQANAEFIRMADQFEEVPGGPNNNNYANVRLIVDIAARTGVQVKCIQHYQRATSDWVVLTLFSLAFSRSLHCHHLV